MYVAEMTCAICDYPLYLLWQNSVLETEGNIGICLYLELSCRTDGRLPVLNVTIR